MAKFKNFLKDLEEEITSGDIATVDTKLGMTRRKNGQKGKKCKKHKRFDCLECTKDKNEH